MRIPASDLRAALHAAKHPSESAAEEYRIAMKAGAGYLALARSGAPAFIVPLDVVPSSAGRRGGGFSLSPAGRVVFEYEGARWEQPAATLECIDDDLIDTFIALVADLASRPNCTTSWNSVVVWLEEWQFLLGRRGGLAHEQQLGLWGELWLMSQSTNPDLLLAAWRGPDQEAVDFFIDGIGVEVKVSRRPHMHYVSQSQVEDPVGDKQAYVLSMWVAPDPVQGVSLAELVDVLVARVSEPAILLRRIGSLGYSPQDRELYITRYLPLEQPLWFLADAVPRVRAADPGVTQLRYVVTLDAERSADVALATELWRRVCQSNGSETKIGKSS